jgi:hypothetical protein
MFYGDGTAGVGSLLGNSLGDILGFRLGSADILGFKLGNSLGN